MSDFPIDDLPDDFKDLIKQIMKNFEKMDPKYFQSLFQQLTDPKFLELFGSTLKNLNLQDPTNDDMLKSIQKIMRDLVKSQSEAPTQNSHISEIPYFEFNIIDNYNGILLVDVPGISEIRNIQWEVVPSKLDFLADEDGVKYSVEISYQKKLQFQGSFATLLNGVFKLPYKIKGD